jgi:hypothetical protein
MNIIIDQIFPSKRKNYNKKESFVIVNTDKNNTGHMLSIIATLKSSGLVEQDFRFRSRSIDKIKFQDVIVVGDCTGAFDYDYRVIKKKHSNRLTELDGRTFKVYDAVKGYNKILKKIAKYAKANLLGDYKLRNRYASHFCCKHASVATPVVVNKTVYRDTACPLQQQQCPLATPACPVLAPKHRSTLRRVDPIKTTEKLTFFDNWVKIGLSQFDVETDCVGNQFITDAGRNKYYISEDRFGRRFLVTK